jgi:predicted O-methyltransferase YrrM
MAKQYICNTDVIEQALDRLKADGLVSDKAYFNYEAGNNLRREVTYRDFDFLTRLGRTAEEETIGSILEWLKKEGIVPVDADYDEGKFSAFREDVSKNFDIPGTSISPVMERLLYMLSSVKTPTRILGFGTYCGYALAWITGPGWGKKRLYQFDQVYGIDIDGEAIEKARDNFSRMGYTDRIRLLAEDGLMYAEKLEGLFDFVYLDVDSRESGKSIYMDLLESVYGRIIDGGWILAHDVGVPGFAEQLKTYLSFVRDKKNFRESLFFDIDPFGLELSIK